MRVRHSIAADWFDLPPDRRHRILEWVDRISPAAHVVAVELAGEGLVEVDRHVRVDGRCRVAADGLSLEVETVLVPAPEPPPDEWWDRR